MRIPSLRKSSLKVMVLVTVFTLLVAACSGDDPTPTQPAATATPTATLAPGVPTPTPAPPTATPTRAPTATPVPNLEELAREHFSGKTITVLVGYGAGGGQDNNARKTAKYLGKYIPGNPRVIVQNKDGADNLLAGQAAWARKSDGLTMVLINNVRTQNQAISGQPEPGFNLFEATYLGNVQISTPGTSATLCARGDVATNWAELLAAAADAGRPLRAGVYRAGSWGAILPKYFDIPVKPVPGFTGTASIMQGIDQSELEVLVDACTFDQISRLRPEWIEDGSIIKPIVNYQGLDLAPAAPMYEGAGWDYPPTLDEVMDLTDFQARLLAVAKDMGSLVTHPWVIKGDTPDFIQQTLIKALEDVTKDTGFIADMAVVTRIAGYTPGTDYARYRDGVADAAAGDLAQAVRDFAGIVD
ncbi:MAG: hypothetical protein O2884_14960 [Chloroflexi bacterium]|nr:hypothetical protein [Chloroflexota bacterium]